MPSFAQQLDALRTTERVLALLELAQNRDGTLEELIWAVRADRDKLLTAILPPRVPALYGVEPSSTTA